MLETTLVALQDVTLDKIFDDSGRKALFAEFAKIMQQVNYTSVVLGICIFAGWDLHVNHGSPCFI